MTGLNAHNEIYNAATTQVETAWKASQIPNHFKDEISKRNYVWIICSKLWKRIISHAHFHFTSSPNILLFISRISLQNIYFCKCQRETDFWAILSTLNMSCYVAKWGFRNVASSHNHFKQHGMIDSWIMHRGGHILPGE